MSNLNTELEDKIIAIGLTHHCLGCVADGSFCPTYEDLPADRRGVRDTILPAIESLITQARREEMQYMITFGYTPEVRLKALEDGEGPTIELEKGVKDGE